MISAEIGGEVFQDPAFLLVHIGIKYPHAVQCKLIVNSVGMIACRCRKLHLHEIIHLKMVFEENSLVKRFHIGPRVHEHGGFSGICGIHRHFSNGLVVISVQVQTQMVSFKITSEFGIISGGFAPTRHIHVDWNFGTFRIIHSVRDIVKVKFCFPVFDEKIIGKDLEFLRTD
ncbi:hypothetical protein SDC9_207341 [bioreactor metagenome]|uniref:Uncharacterized protein n=1 Tax=bioreactor metagenome TaxID=1076179 RepID=A0A645J900_9ZZZZ